MPKRSDYLYQRAGSRNWYVKLQYPSYVPQGVRRDGKAVWRKSPDTVDYDVAKRAAAPYVLEFLERKLAFKSLADRTQSHGEIREYQNGRGFISIERNTGFHEISKARLAKVMAQ
jgi:hypothetical protein